MTTVHVYIDGSWLYKLCQKSNNTDIESGAFVRAKNLNCHFQIDFEKLSNTLSEIMRKKCGDEINLFRKIIVTSVFKVGEKKFNDYCNKEEIINAIRNTPFRGKFDLSDEEVERIANSIISRRTFAGNAVKYDYNKNDNGFIFESILNEQRLRSYINSTYTEKMVDTALVASLVKGAIINKYDYHCLVAGDADMISALKVAYPDYHKNIFLATVDPKYNTTAKELVDEFKNDKFPPIFLDKYCGDFKID